jgi:predicted SnoaL-like aldol condensation-catalyzing enzyme
MKKLSLLICIAMTGFFVSCKNENSGGPSDKARKNMEVNTAIMKAYAAGDFSKMNEYIADDAVDHGGENGDITGRDNIVTEMKRYHEMMPDMKVETIKDLADDDYVFSWAKSSGTMNGKMTTMTTIDVSRFKDGKAVEHWVFMDPKEMMQMMGPMPTDSMATASADSSHK